MTDVYMLCGSNEWVTLPNTMQFGIFTTAAAAFDRALEIANGRTPHPFINPACFRVDHWVLWVQPLVLDGPAQDGQPVSKPFKPVPPPAGFVQPKPLLFDNPQPEKPLDYL